MNTVELAHQQLKMCQANPKGVIHTSAETQRLLCEAVVDAEHDIGYIRECLAPGEVYASQIAGRWLTRYAKGGM